MPLMMVAMHSPRASRISESSMEMVLGTPSMRFRPVMVLVMGLIEGEGGAELHLDLLGGALADEQVVLALDVGDDGLVHLVSGHADGARVDDAGEGDDGDVGGAAADIDDHVSAGLGDGEAGSDGGDHGLLDQVNFRGFGAVGGVHDGALFYLGDLRGDADDDAGVDHHLAVVGLLDEVVQHLFGLLEVGDDAVLHGLDGDDVAGVRPSISLASLPTASTSPVIWLTAMMLGSLTIIPLPWAKTRVFAVPRSMARSDEKRLKRERMLCTRE